MSPVTSGNQERRRRRLVAAIKESLRDLNIQLSLLNRQVGGYVELFRLLAGMSSSMDRVCADYTDTELELVAGFLGRTSAAAAEATEGLGG